MPSVASPSVSEPPEAAGPCSCGCARGPGLGLRDEFGDAEVHQLHAALRIEQDVLRLDVAVQHALLVGVLQRVANLRHDRERLLRRETARPHRLAQVHAIHKLHEQVEEIPRPPRVMHRDDVRMMQPGEQLPLAGEALREGRIVVPPATRAAASRPRGGSASAAAPATPCPCRPCQSSSMISNCGNAAVTSAADGGFASRRPPPAAAWAAPRQPSGSAGTGCRRHPTAPPRRRGRGSGSGEPWSRLYRYLTHRERKVTRIARNF